MVFFAKTNSNKRKKEMKNPIPEIKKLSRRQATLYSLAVCFCVFYLTTLAPVLTGFGGKQPEVMAGDTPEPALAGTEIQLTTLPPNGTTVAENANSRLGSFEAKGIFTVPAEIKFSTAYDKGISYYQWSFGEEAPVSGPTPHVSHTYKESGVFRVSVDGYFSEEDFKAGKIADRRELEIRIKEKFTSSTGWIWPTKGRLYRGWSSYHHGLDITNKSGTPITAARSGVVVKVNTSGWGGGYGSYVVIRHDNGLYSIYAHMSKVLAKTGQKVYTGERIGLMGTTGRSSGVHLHFGIGPTLMVNSGTLNPIKYLPAR
jgi:murein DD-endopeptidase MepM/ murein hydrolase activator NlpD